MEENKLYNVAVKMVELYAKELTENYDEEITQKIYKVINDKDINYKIYEIIKDK